MKKHRYSFTGLIRPALICFLCLGVVACAQPADSPASSEVTSSLELITPEPPDPATPEATATTAPTEVATPEPTTTPVPTSTATPVPTPTVTPAPTATPVPTPTVTPEPTATPVPTPTVTPAPTATPIPTPTATPKPTATPVPTSTPVPTKKPTPTPAIYAANGITKDLPKFSGYSYVIADAETGETLLSYNGERFIYPASTIKLLTAMTALDLAEPSTLLTTKQTILDGVDWDVWVMDVPAGTTYSLEVWLNLLLIQSYGDVADTIADGVGGSIDAFVARMNEKLDALGLSDTSVDNPIGLDISNNYHKTYTNANDMMKITLEALKYPLIQEILQKNEYLVPANGAVKEHTIENSNQLQSKPGTYHSDLFTTLSGKTGSTDDAGKCLSAIVKSNQTGRRYACVYYGAPNTKTMYPEIIGLLEYVIENYE